MAWWNETYLIGERVKVEGEKNVGVITRIDFDRKLIYVMFKRLREKAFPYPESIENKTLTPLVDKKS